jgi:hypothetical protein
VRVGIMSAVVRLWGRLDTWVTQQR